MTKLNFRAIFLLVASACNPIVGQGLNPGPTRTQRKTPKLPDPAEEALVCKAKLGITGSYVKSADAPLPAADDARGCIPHGTWTLAVSLLSKGDCQSVPFNPQYTYDVGGNSDEDAYVITNRNDPDGTMSTNKITTTGPGDCEGTFENHSPDGKGNLILKPFLRADGSIDGIAYYELRQ